MLVVIAILHAPAPALGDEPAKTRAPAVSTSDRFPVVGKATSVTTGPEADSIELLYSPSSEVEARQSVPIRKLTPPEADKPYHTAWIPERAGVVALTAGGTTVNVSVAFDGIPIGGIAIMLIAGLILFGGTFVSVRSLLTPDTAIAKARALSSDDG
jgi:hypothetical protein